MDNNFVAELVNREFDQYMKSELMSKISNWNKCQDYFDSQPSLDEILDCLSIELQTKARPEIAKRLHQRWENIQRGDRALALGRYITAKNKNKRAA